MIDGFLAVEKDRPMHTGGIPFLIDNRSHSKEGVGHPLAKLETKLEHAFTDPSYREVSTRPAWIRYTHQRRTFRSLNSSSPQRSAV